MIFIPIFFFGNTGDSGPLVIAGRYGKLRNFVALALGTLAFISPIVIFAAGHMDPVYLSFSGPSKHFLASLLPHHDVFAFLAVAAAALIAPLLMFCTVCLRDDFIITALGVVMVVVLTAMAVTAFIPLGI